ncbi:MAG TPA: alpha/beta hydrolase [Bryobacteraceae bacterium]|jgi:pimeloyl-ACP methyl ester carboxylesterase|nr:alpha/beta hydrolase [Bryobacteraceae bacterium]
MPRRRFLTLGAAGAAGIVGIAAAGNQARAAANDASRFARFNGVRVHYESYGAGGEALVFIHGWACDLTFWRGQQALYDHPERRALLIDLPGHGSSDKPHRSYPIEFFARAVEAVMRDAQVERAVLIGHSLGGPIAYAFLREFPEKASALALVDAFVSRHMAGPADRAATAAHFAKIARSLQGAAGERNFAERVESCFTPQTPPALRAEIRAKMAATPKYVRIAALSSISSLGPPPDDETFDLPAIAIQAAEPGTQARFELMRSIFPRLQLNIWEGAGHFLMLEDPQRFNAEVEQFLAARS